MKNMAQRIEELKSRRAEVELGGGKERIEKQHQGGKLTARERIAELVRPEQFSGIRHVRRTSRHAVRHVG